MSKAVAIITDRVRERIRLDGVDLAADRTLAGRYVHDEAQRYSEHALGGSLPLLVDEQQATRDVVAAIVGFGVLQPRFDDPEVEANCRL